MVMVSNDVDRGFLQPGSLSEDSIIQNPPGDPHCSFGTRDK